MKLPGYIHIPKRFDRLPSHSLHADMHSRIARALLCVSRQLQSQSGVRLLTEADDALRERIALIQNADRTLDLQYYKWLQDSSGTLLLSHLIAAADRGVRVRLLLDDIHFEGEANAISLNQHPNIEVRLFNPFEFRRMTPLTRPLEWLTINRVNHRMHNKLMLADNLAAITGGRNISDRYFGIDNNLNYRDLDLFIIGKAIPEMSNAFDQFWNSRWSVPVEKVIAIQLSGKQRKRLQHLLRRFQRSRTFGQHSKLQQIVQTAAPALTEDLIWVDAQTVYDSPEKVGRSNDVGKTAALLQQLALKAKTQLTIVTPYLISSPGLMAMLTELLNRGVRVTILTNSLASNDVTIAHSGYSKLRKKLLQHAVRLFELSPSAQFQHDDDQEVDFSLHTKAMVIDDEQLFIGSHNADPRSIHINTEMGLVLKSHTLAQRVLDNIKQHTEAGRAWRVRYFKQQLHWRRRLGERIQILRIEPEAPLCKRCLANLGRLLPVAHQL